MSEINTTQEEKDYSDLDLIYDLDVYEAYASNCHLNMDELEVWQSEAEDSYQGQWDSDEEFAEQLITDTRDVDKDSFLFLYIDWEKLARDTMYDYFEEHGHYFRS